MRKREGFGDSEDSGLKGINAMTIQSYRDLAVWQKAMDLVIACYSLSRSFPDTEKFGLSSQLQRAAVSVPANIAEGRGRRNTKEFIRHLSIAYGSLCELETHLLIAIQLNYITSEHNASLLTQTALIGRMINNLQDALRRRLSSPPNPMNPSNPES